MNSEKYTAILNQLHAEIDRLEDKGKLQAKHIEDKRKRLEELDEYVMQLEANIQVLSNDLSKMNESFQDLKKDAQKLVCWCEIFGLNPEEIFSHDLEDLNEFMRSKKTSKYNEKDLHFVNRAKGFEVALILQKMKLLRTMEEGLAELEITMERRKHHVKAKTGTQG